MQRRRHRPSPHHAVDGKERDQGQDCCQIEEQSLWPDVLHQPARRARASACPQPPGEEQSSRGGDEIARGDVVVGLCDSQSIERRGGAAEAEGQRENGLETAPIEEGDGKCKTCGQSAGDQHQWAAAEAIRKQADGELNEQTAEDGDAEQDREMPCIEPDPFDINGCHAVEGAGDQA